MPMKPKTACRHPGCPALTHNAYCEDHTNQQEHKRSSAGKRGYDYRWRQARQERLQQEPICVMCAKEGRVTLSVVVDHIVPHRGVKELFWDQSNWQALCKPCHDRKTRTQDQFPTYTY
jgi:5-methylcytosine-specific restriction protein A